MTTIPIDLKGLRVLNTRPEPGHDRLKRQIEAAGGTSIALPLLKIEPLPPQWIKTLPSLENIHNLIFISPNAVSIFFDALHTQDLHLPPSLRLFAIGQQTHHTLNSFGYAADFAEKADSEDFLNLAALQNLTGQKTVLVKGEGGRTLIRETLKRRGAEVIELDVYKRINLPLDLLRVAQLWQNETIDIIIYTSLQSMKHLHHALPEPLRTALIAIPCVVFSERLAVSARQFGHHQILITPPQDLLVALETLAKG